MPERKHSKKRDAIYECLRNTTTHPSAEWVYAQLKPTIPDLSLGTVYRNLRTFREEGKLISVGVVNGLERFDARTSPHAHFVCRRCSAVLDVDSIALPEHLSLELDCGEAEDYTLTLSGLCRDCIKHDAS